MSALDMKDEAARRIEALPQATRTAIEARFADMPAFVDNVAARMRSDVPFPAALVQSIRETDPRLAADVERSLSRPAAPRAAPEAVRDAGVSGGEEAARTTVEVRGKSEAGVIGRTPAATAGAEATISRGEGFSLRLAGGGLLTPGRADAMGTAELTMGNLVLTAYRDPTIEVAGAGAATYYLDAGRGFSLGAGAEAGIATGGGGYALIAPSLSFEGARLKFDITPLINVAPQAALGALATAELQLTDSVSLTARGYAYDVAAPRITALAGVSVSL